MIMKKGNQAMMRKIAKAFFPATMFFAFSLVAFASTWAAPAQGTTPPGNNAAAPASAAGDQVIKGGLIINWPKDYLSPSDQNYNGSAETGLTVLNGNLAVPNGSLWLGAGYPPFQNPSVSWNPPAGSLQVGTAGGTSEICLNGTTGASCITAWPSGGTSQWTTSGSNISYNAGNVGIGAAPASGNMLDISSTAGSVGNSAIRALFPAGGGLTGTEFGALAYRNSQWQAVYAKGGTQGASALYTDGQVEMMNGNAGVGVAPFTKFDVASAADSGDGIAFTNNGNNTNTIQSYIDGHWSDRATYAGGCCNSLLLNPDAGNVGIGSAAPGARLEILNTASQPALSIGDSSVDDSSTYGMVNLTRPADTTRAHLAFIRTGNYVWQMGYVANSNTFGIFPWNLTSGGTPAMSFTTGGSVGVGIAAPRTKFDVWGGVISATGSDYNGTALMTSSGGIAYFSNNTVGTGLSVDSGGNVGVSGEVTCIQGTCPPNGAIRITPNLHLNSGAGYAVIANWDNGTTGASQAFRVGNGAGADAFYVLANGNVVANGGMTANSLKLTGRSGIRLDVSDLTGGGTLCLNGGCVTQIKPTYNIRSVAGNSTTYAVAYCDSGDIATGGGINVTTADNIRGSYPYFSGGSVAVGWACSLATSGNFTCYANCVHQ